MKYTKKRYQILVYLFEFCIVEAEGRNLTLNEEAKNRDDLVKISCKHHH